MVFPRDGLAGSVERVDTHSSNCGFQHGFSLVSEEYEASHHHDDRWLVLRLGSTAGAVLLVLCPFHLKACL